MRALILVVDDDPQVLVVVQRALSNPSYKVLATTDPFEAARLLGSEEFRLVVSDLEMPGLDGHQVMSRAKNVCPGAVRIMLTGVSEIAEVKRAINEDEVHRYLSKPFEPDQLRAEVARALALHRELAEREAARHDANRRVERIHQLESETPGLTQVTRDASGAYRIDPERLRRLRRQIPLGGFSGER